MKNSGQQRTARADSPRSRARSDNAPKTRRLRSSAAGSSSRVPASSASIRARDSATRCADCALAARKTSSRDALQVDAEQFLQQAFVEVAGVEAAGCFSHQAHAHARQMREGPLGPRCDDLGVWRLARGKRLGVTRSAGRKLEEARDLRRGLRRIRGAVDPAVAVRRPRQRVGSKIDAAQRVEAQPAAAPRLGEGPERQRCIALLRDAPRHGGVGEGHLQDEQQIEPPSLELRQRPRRRVRVEEEPTRTDDLGIERAERLERLGRLFELVLLQVTNAQVVARPVGPRIALEAVQEPGPFIGGQVVGFTVLESHGRIVLPGGGFLPLLSGSLSRQAEQYQRKH